MEQLMTDPYQQTADLFKALAHPTRLQILDLLRGGEVCVCHIEAALDKRQAYISQQLMTLREAGLVDTRRDGLQIYYRLADDRLHAILETLPGADRPAPIENCPCPTCATVILSQIQ
jgi:ArsR family transcriptional regulator